ncbi:DUF1822 family protein [Microseira wollei]|uniref:DUF1822 family protein n=1 Tax=Microseira wollei NIES-4236 TaxID=2530354 RepID=A0AAV3X8H8_9CYAN|nr:DUF1822 family protein [Microseira wollei]GET36990.1 hypothetical protein MiSe_17430 [Microseira wollei NIES-4236]
MTYYSNNLAALDFDFEAFPVEAIALESANIERAIQISSAIPNESQQWQTYLNALALFGFEQWLDERASDIPLESAKSTVLQPQYANVFPAVANLNVGSFKLCLIATGSSSDEEVIIPQPAIDLPEFAAHFYVLIEIQEEFEQAIIRGFLRRDRLNSQCHSLNLQPNSDWTYSVPLAWFDSEADRLLLYLRCLEPGAILLPEIASDPVAALSTVQAELETLLPLLQSRETALWQVLNWQQGAAVLTNPELLEWVYQLQIEAIGDEASETKNELRNYLSDLLNLLTQRTVNVARWLQDQIDELAQGLSWVLMPPTFVPATVSMRSTQSLEALLPVAEFEEIIRQLAHTGMEIPTAARGAYQDIGLADIQARLYALTWPFLSPEDTPEWTLLLVLGPTPDSALPHGIRLRVSDQSGVLVQRTLNRNSMDTYLYVLIAGRWDEKFLATITLPNGTTLTLPPFAFRPEFGNC